MKILFLYLSAFSVTGGIEKFNKAFMKALSEISAGDKNECRVFSVHDVAPDKKYFSQPGFRGFSGNKFRFIIAAVMAGIRSDKVFIGHINIAFAGLLIKIINPKVKLFLIAHGIEIWNEVGSIKKIFLKRTDHILAVSNYTKERIIESHKFPLGKITILHNTLDPFFNIPSAFIKPAGILKKLSIKNDDIVLLTVGRLSSLEKQKGYDNVLSVLPEIRSKFPGIKYLLAGRYDEKEYLRIIKSIDEKGLNDSVILTGYISEDELTGYYLTGDIFIMPSKQEGFGIVFIEAMACGLPVIAGNTDGSRDAVFDKLNNRLIDPDNIKQISDSIIDLINNRVADKEQLQQSTIEKFGFCRFTNDLKTILTI